MIVIFPLLVSKNVNTNLVQGASTLCTADLFVSTEIGAAVCALNEGLLRNVASVIAEIGDGTPTSSFATDAIVELDDCLEAVPQL